MGTAVLRVHGKPRQGVAQTPVARQPLAFLRCGGSHLKRECPELVKTEKSKTVARP